VATRLTIVIVVGYHCCERHIKLHPFSFPRLNSYIDSIILDWQCGFRCSRSTTDQIFFYIRQIQERKWEYNETVHQLFIDFKKAYNSVKEVLCNILIDFGVPNEASQVD
jgi:hypothetical protein